MLALLPGVSRVSWLAPATESSMEAEDARSHPDNLVHAELLALAHEAGLKSIQTQILAQPSEENGHRCIIKAVVEVEKGRFEAIGDADPGNVEQRFAPHLIRV